MTSHDNRRPLGVSKIRLLILVQFVKTRPFPSCAHKGQYVQSGFWYLSVSEAKIIFLAFYRLLSPLLGLPPMRSRGYALDYGSYTEHVS